MDNTQICILPFSYYNILYIKASKVDQDPESVSG